MSDFDDEELLECDSCGGEDFAGEFDNCIECGAELCPNCIDHNSDGDVVCFSCS